ncbi:MAG: hypothetical protein RLZZ361_878 [Cyanobacteriota bacterium]|jgi:UDP-N-acetylmuramyl tripeptide synthase
MKQILAVNLSKIVTSLIKFLKLGSASSLPGRIALFINPKTLQEFADQLNDLAKYAFFITGTNGKTTSTGLLKQILLAKESGRRIICNDFGANLYYGITTEFIHSSDSCAKLISNNYVLEVDEASLPKLGLELYPKTLAITNLFRDQLDRFGEIDSTQKLLVTGIKNIIKYSSSLNLILNADDPKVASIKDLLIDSSDFPKLKIFYYTIKFIDAKNAYSIQDFDSNQQKTLKIIPDLIVNIQQEKIDSSIINYEYQNFISTQIELKLPGLYNVYNAGTAIACALVSGIGFDEIKSGIENYNTAFGRSEIKTFNNRKYQSFLIKNPTGCSEVLRHLSKNQSANFLIAINDNYADGRDVSWLWDANFEYLTNIQDSTFVCSGKRAHDMALRLKYAGISEKKIFTLENLKEALFYCLNLDPQKNVYVLPTYTALLELNRI